MLAIYFDLAFRRRVTAPKDKSKTPRAFKPIEARRVYNRLHNHWILRNHFYVNSGSFQGEPLAERRGGTKVLGRWSTQPSNHHHHHQAGRAKKQKDAHYTPSSP